VDAEEGKGEEEQNFRLHQPTSRMASTHTQSNKPLGEGGQTGCRQEKNFKP
jgi:hypothetical protein